MDGGTDGASHRLTTNFSASLDSNGVAEIGLYSTSESGLATLGTGVITAFCHCSVSEDRVSTFSADFLK